jgi:hypothetical protein
MMDDDLKPLRLKRERMENGKKGRVEKQDTKGASTKRDEGLCKGKGRKRDNFEVAAKGLEYCENSLRIIHTLLLF